MKTCAQFLWMMVFSALILFPQNADARLFSARLMAVQPEAFPQVQLGDSEEANFSSQNETGLIAEAAARPSQSVEYLSCSSFDSSPEDVRKDALEARANEQRARATDHD